MVVQPMGGGATSWGLGGCRRLCGERSPRWWGETTTKCTPSGGRGREEPGLFLCYIACGLYSRTHNLSDSVVAEEAFPPLGIGYENKFHWPFGRGEDKCGLVGLFVKRYKPHVSRHDSDEG